MKLDRWIFGGGPAPTESSITAAFSRRAFVLGLAQTGIGGLLAARMGYVSIAEHQRYSDLADENRISTRLIPPRRGWIVDRYGNPMAVNRSDFRVDLIPDRLEEPDRVIPLLAQLLELSPETVARIREDLRAAAGFQPVPVAEHLSFEKFAAVNVRLPELPGVSPLRAFSRYYPEGAAVGHLIGYVGTPNREEYNAEDRNPLLIAPGFKVGKEGLEKVMERGLRGRPGAARVEVTARGRLVRELTTLPDIGGPPLRTTIDAGLQSYAARRAGEQSAALSVIDCRTGDILALVSMPCYDPNSFSDGISHAEWDMMAEDERHPLINKVLQGLYPPGSTSKPMTSLALLEAGVDPEETVTCTGAYRVGNAVFHCASRGGHGAIALHEAIIKSCDIYYYAMGRRVGIDPLAAMARRMSLGARYDLPFPSQRYGTVPDAQWLRRRENRDWAEYDTVNMSIGQGYLLVNPLQQAVMMARIASGRTILPRILANAPAGAFEPLPVSEEHRAFVLSGMDGVVNSGRGTASVARLPVDGVIMGGKTGTAQVRNISRGERASGVRSNASLAWRLRDHSWFVAFAPVAEPRYACAAIVEHGGWGASAAAPLVRDVMTYLFDKDRAMEALLPMEASWGGGIADRMARRTQEWASRAPGMPPPRSEPA